MVKCDNCNKNAEYRLTLIKENKSQSLYYLCWKDVKNVSAEAFKGNRADETLTVKLH